MANAPKAKKLLVPDSIKRAKARRETVATKRAKEDKARVEILNRMAVPRERVIEEEGEKRVVASSPALAAPYGRSAAQDAVQRFRDAYAGIADFWRQTMVGAALDTLAQVAERHSVISEAARIKQCVHIIGTEMQSPEKRIKSLIEANNDLIARERRMRRQRDAALRTALRTASRLLDVMERRWGPLNDAKIEKILAKIEAVNGEKE